MEGKEKNTFIFLGLCFVFLHSSQIICNAEFIFHPESLWKGAVRNHAFKEDPFICADENWNLENAHLLCKNMGFSEGAMNFSKKRGVVNSEDLTVNCIYTDPDFIGCGQRTGSCETVAWVACQWPGFRGCYAGLTLPSFSQEKVTPSSLTIQSCLIACRSTDKTYAALSGGRSCYCSNEPPTGTRDDERCDTECPGDEDQACGGDAPTYSAVYETFLGSCESSVTSNGPTYLASPGFPYYLSGVSACTWTFTTSYYNLTTVRVIAADTRGLQKLVTIEVEKIDKQTFSESTFRYDIKRPDSSNGIWRSKNLEYKAEDGKVYRNVKVTFTPNSERVAFLLTLEVNQVDFEIPTTTTSQSMLTTQNRCTCIRSSLFHLMESTSPLIPLMMEDHVQQGARPNQSVDHGRGRDTGFGQFCVTVESNLTKKNSVKLATLFEYKPAEIEEIENSDNPSHMFVQFMIEKGQICESDISQFINALKLKTVDLNGIAVKLEKAFKDVVNEKKTTFQEQLKTTYDHQCGARRPVPFHQKQFSVNELFVESGAEYLKKSQNLHEDWAPLQSCRSILIDPQVKSKRRILLGEPGIGKSMFVLQIAHDWVNNHESMKDVEFLILLRLRQYRNMSSVYAAIKRCLLPKESELSEEDIKGLICSYQSSTLIILDGYDEYPDRKETDVHRIIKGEMFANCDVILTSRFNTSKGSPSTQCIRLTGFDDKARDTYINKAVVDGDAKAAKPVKDFFSGNPVSAYLYHIPLFFVMAAHMTHWYPKFKNIETVTKFFQSVIRCLESHEQTRTGGASRQENLVNHQKLSEIAFEGLMSYPQQMSWDKNVLYQRLGEEYDVYIRMGILIEEVIFDLDSLDYKTEVGFYHKLFCEWFAAQYIAKEAARPGVRFEFDSGWARCWIQVARQEQVLRLVYPHLVEYVYLFACGLNSDAAMKIIAYLGRGTIFKDCMLACIKEWGGNLENIFDTVTSLCARGITVNASGTILHEDSVIIKILRFASQKRIPILRLLLRDCLDFSCMYSGNLHLKRCNLSVPEVPTLEELQIWEVGREISEEHTNCILQYASKCTQLKVLWFSRCFLPRYIKVTESLRSRDVTVLWHPGKFFILNLESCTWEEVTCTLGNMENRNVGEDCKAARMAHANRGATITDEDYKGARCAVQLHAKYKKKP